MAEAKLKKEKPPEGNALVRYVRTRHDPLTSLLLITPVFLLYHLGVLFTPMRNGVDFITDLLNRVAELNTAAYVGLTIGIAACIGVAVYVLRRRGTIQPFTIAPVLVESALWAVVVWLVAGWGTAHVVSGQTGPRPMNLFTTIVMCAGAGFHEELVFRVGLFAGGAFLLTKMTSLGKAPSMWVMACVSAVLFSLSHYIGEFGDAFHVSSFVFRVIMGFMFAGLYRFRGLAVAVYTHVFYDLLYFFILM